MMDFFKKHTLIAGAAVLTASGFLSRFLGFFYRIFLSRTIGAEGLGIYQMIFPLYGICFSLCAGSIQTAISRFVAARPENAGKILKTGFLIAFSISTILSLGIFQLSDFLAVSVLREPRCAPLLPALALAFPFTTVHACVCGYYYGKEKVHVPALSQLVEQCTRIFAVFLAADVCQENKIPLTVGLAVFGLVIGEAVSALFTLLAYLLFSKNSDQEETSRPVAGPLMRLAAPLMANRLVMNLLQSAEAILIPSRLLLFGLTQPEALSVYGVLTGMAMSFIMFPSAIINSLAVVLLPSVAKAQSAGNGGGISRSIAISFRYSLYMGVLCVGIFTVFGERLGTEVFANRDAGTFIPILAWLCPFLYLATTMGSILNGLGMTAVTFRHNLAAMILRLLFVIFFIPRAGIRGYLWGLLASEILLALLHLQSLLKTAAVSPNVWDVLIKPILCLFFALGIFRLFPTSLTLFKSAPPFFTTAVQIGIVCLGYLLTLWLFHRPSSDLKD